MINIFLKIILLKNQKIFLFSLKRKELIKKIIFIFFLKCAISTDKQLTPAKIIIFNFCYF